MNHMETLFMAVIAFVGGLVRTLKSDGKKTYVTFVSEGLVSGFSGIVIYFLLADYVSGNLLIGIVSWSGYAGVHVLDMVGDFFKTKLKN